MDHVSLHLKHFRKSLGKISTSSNFRADKIGLNSTWICCWAFPFKKSDRGPAGLDNFEKNKIFLHEVTNKKNCLVEKSENLFLSLWSKYFFKELLD